MKACHLFLYLFISINLLASESKDRISDHDWKTVGYQTFSELPQSIVLDFESLEKVYGFVYIPNPFHGEGRIKEYNLLLSENGKDWKKVIDRGRFSAVGATSIWPNSKENFDTVFFKKAEQAKFLKLEVLSVFGPKKIITIAELQPIFNNKKYPFKGQTLASLKGSRYAPSIHLRNRLPRDKEVVSFYNEITIQKSVPGSFFMACGFNAGYFGLQERRDGKKVLLFSVWDKHRGDDPRNVPREKRVKVVYQDPSMLVQRFGNEGTGGQSFLDLDWKIGEKYRFHLELEHKGERNEYTAFFYMPNTKWKKLLTFSTLSSSKDLRGFHSFLEDFKRDFKSFNQLRQAEISNSHYRTKDGQWFPVSEVFFSRDSNPHFNVDCLVKENSSVLKTGGDIKNENLKLWTGATYKKSSTTIAELPVNKVQK